MRVHSPRGVVLNFTSSDFVGQGAQGKVYVQGGNAYKIFHDPGEMVPPRKIEELARIKSPRVLRPTEVLRDDAGLAIGYAMDYVEHAAPICRLFPRIFRDTNGITASDMCLLATDMLKTLSDIHRAGSLVVDLNELNILVSSDFHTAYFIDTDSYATPSFPATAIMDTIRDRHAPPGQFSEGTDWFAFAVITFQLFTGLHPYRGRHPRWKTLDERMLNCASAFDPSVILPPTAGGIETIPQHLRAWYEQVFQSTFRGPPPTDFGPHDAIQLTEAGDAASLAFDVEGRFHEPVRIWRQNLGRTVVVTEDWIYVDGNRRGPAPKGQVQIMFSPERGVPVVASWSAAGGVCLWDTERLATSAFGLRADAMVATRHGQVFVKNGRQLIALDLLDTAGGVIVGPRPIAQVHQYATQVFPGVLVQQLLGTTYFGCLTAVGLVNHRIPELEGYRIVEAAFDNSVLVVLAFLDQKYHRFIIRFADHGSDYRVVHEADVAPTGVDHLVLDSGVVVIRDSDGSICLLDRDPASKRKKQVSGDDAGHFRLVHKPYGLGFVRGAETGTLRLR